MVKDELVDNQYGPDGFDKDGFDKDGFDKQGYDKDGFDNLFGFNKNGIHRLTRTKYDELGFDEDRIHKITGTIYDENGIRSDGYDPNDPDQQDLVEDSSEDEEYYDEYEEQNNIDMAKNCVADVFEEESEK